MMQMIRYVAILLAICIFSSISGVFAAVTAVGSPTTISTSTIGSTNFESINPDVAYDPTNNQYLAVWSGDIASNRFQIFGRLINAETGAAVGATDFLIGEAAATFNAGSPAVAYDAENGNYLVVWESDEAGGGTEIFGRIVTASGVPQGASSGIAISTMGAAREAKDPDVCYNTATDSYLVVWSGDDLATLALGEFEIFARAVNLSGTPTGVDKRISQMGQLNAAAEGFAGANPTVACNNSGSGEYYVVWWGDDVGNQDMEIYAQRLNASLAEVGVDDDKISLMGQSATGINTPPDDGFRARYPDVTYNSSDNRYLVVWEGGDTTSPAAGNGFEIHGQLINATNGSEITPNDFKISEMGGSAGDVTRDARFPAVSYSSVSNEYVAVWEGDDDSGADDNFQIYASAVADDGTVDSANADVAISEATVGDGVVRSARNAGPAIAFGTSNAQYLATWEEEVTGENFEVRARGLTGSNNDAIIRLTETAITVAENAGTATVTVQRTGNTSNAVTVDIATTSGTADLIDDFTDASATLSFASGDTEETVSISITDDDTAESNETINIALSNASAGATISAASAVLTITDDDSDGGGSSGGGGGCALSTKSGFDPLFPLLMLIAGAYLIRRRVIVH